jgi:hypothetical protein
LFLEASAAYMATWLLAEEALRMESFMCRSGSLGVEPK